MVTRVFKLTLLYRYILAKMLKMIVVVLLALISLSLVIRIGEQISEVGRGSWTTFDAIIFSLCYSAKDFSIYLPMAILIGSIVALGQFASHRELIVIQAAGVSKKHIILSFLWFIIPMGIADLLVQEYVTPNVTSFAQTYKSNKQNAADFYTKDQTIWAKSESEFIYAQADQAINLRHTVVMSFKDNHLDKVIIGSNTRWSPEKQAWIMEKAVIYGFDKPPQANAIIAMLPQDSNWRQVQDYTPAQANEIIQQMQQGVNNLKHSFSFQIYANYVWHTSLDPQKFKLVVVDLEYLSISSLYNYIAFLDHTHQNSDSYKYLVYSKLLSPFSMFIMLLMATLTIFGNVRSVNMLIRTFYGVILGLIYYVLNNTVGPLMVNYLPSLVATLIPNLCFIMLVIGLNYLTSR